MLRIGRKEERLSEDSDKIPLYSLVKKQMTLLSRIQTDSVIGQSEAECANALHKAKATSPTNPFHALKHPISSTRLECY